MFVEATKWQDDNGFGGKDVTRCGAETFMIRDGVCDEKTNTEACLWDGGDCCLNSQKKDRTLCRECVCQVTVNETQLMTAFRSTEVMLLPKDLNFDSLILKTAKIVPDVFMADVCSLLCLELVDTVNGWSYDGLEHTCTCAWLKSTECIREMDLTEVDVNRFLNPSYGVALSIALVIESYVQLAKTVDCSKYFRILLRKYLNL